MHTISGVHRYQLQYFCKKHAVEPLWWLNLLDYAYNEIINAPRHKKLPKPVLDDADV